MLECWWCRVLCKRKAPLSRTTRPVCPTWPFHEPKKGSVHVQLGAFVPLTALFNALHGSWGALVMHRRAPLKATRVSPLLFFLHLGVMAAAGPLLSDPSSSSFLFFPSPPPPPTTSSLCSLSLLPLLSVAFQLHGRARRPLGVEGFCPFHLSGPPSSFPPCKESLCPSRSRACTVLRSSQKKKNGA